MTRTIIYLITLIAPLTSCITNIKEPHNETTNNKPVTKNNTMEDQNFTTTLLVDQTPEEVFNAVTHVSAWWSEEIEGGTAKLNDQFVYRYKDMHRCSVKLTEVVPGKKVAWRIMDNYFSFTEDTSEWKNTNVLFEISRKGDKTELRFTHEGLVPDYECYEVCREGWSNYIDKSLKNLITTGKGQPNPKEGGFNSDLAEKWKLK